MAFKLNLTEAEIKQAQGGNFEPLPEGTYGAIIYEVVEKQSKAGNDMYEITFKITDGPEGIGRQVKGWFVVTGKALFSVVGLLKALGLPYPNKDTPPGESLLNEPSERDEEELDRRRQEEEAADKEARKEGEGQDKGEGAGVSLR